MDPLGSYVGAGTLSLERLKVAAQGRLSGHLARSTEVRVAEDMMMDQLVFQLRAEVLAEKVLEGEVSVPWSGETVVETRSRGVWAVLALGVALTFATPLVGLWAALAAMLLALLGVALIAANAPGEEVVPVSGSVTVPATYWRKFPEANFAYPPELGGPVRMALLGEPYWRADR